MKPLVNFITHLSSIQITAFVGLGLVSFVIWPTVLEQVKAHNPLPLLFSGSNNNMQLLRRKKKVGRYTVGLTNRANDCFANSNLQALASLKGLYTYLVQISFLIPTEGQVLQGHDNQQGNESLPADSPNVPSKEYGRLSRALQAMICDLNKPVLVPTSISPWTLLAVLEAIYRSRISRSQHDAHELLHLILETLENENETLANARKDHKFKVPEFPFKGATVDRITCSKCGFSPPANPSMFLVLSLMVPQKRHITLMSLLDSQSSPEFIQDYGCTNCRLLHVLNSNPVITQNFDPSLREELTKYVECPEKLPDVLEEKLPREVTSPIAKSTRFQSLPQVLVIHLSRSIYGGYGASRNSCKVSIEDRLELFENQGSGPFDKRKVNYRLSAMIRHKGTHQAGHYECFRRKNLNWWNDIINSSKSSASNNNRGKDTEGWQNGGIGTIVSTTNAMTAVASASNPDLSTNTGRNISSLSFSGQESKQSHETPTSPALTCNSSSPTSISSKSSCNASSTSSLPSIDEDIRGLRPNLPFSNSSLPSPASVSLNEISSTLVGPPRTATSSPGPPGVLPPSSQEWWRISDERVWECTTKDVLKEESGAYLLFYEKV